jgi:hypothetical protein
VLHGEGAGDALCGDGGDDDDAEEGRDLGGGKRGAAVNVKEEVAHVGEVALQAEEAAEDRVRHRWRVGGEGLLNH